MKYSYLILSTIISAWLLSQTLKIVIRRLVFKEQITFKAVFENGHFPSSHSSTAIAFSVMITNLASKYIDNPVIKECIISITIFFTLYFIFDAVKVRGRIDRLADEVDFQFSGGKTGHTVKEVIGGISLGIIVGFLFSFVNYELAIMIVGLTLFLMLALFVFSKEK